MAGDANDAGATSGTKNTIGWAPGDGVIVSQCGMCRHKHADGFTCDAFPDDPPGIPEAMFRNEHDHRRPYPGDRGIRFEAKVD